ncbi:hypothetical protein BDD12DRAFT_820969, partial [Trichophaea hybrida]
MPNEAHGTKIWIMRFYLALYIYAQMFPRHIAVVEMVCWHLLLLSGLVAWHGFHHIPRHMGMQTTI